MTHSRLRWLINSCATDMVNRTWVLPRDCLPVGLIQDAVEVACLDQFGFKAALVRRLWPLLLFVLRIIKENRAQLPIVTFSQFIAAATSHTIRCLWLLNNIRSGLWIIGHELTPRIARMACLSLDILCLECSLFFFSASYYFSKSISAVSSAFFNLNTFAISILNFLGFNWSFYCYY
jgi:hypothetical protein